MTQSQIKAIIIKDRAGFYGCEEDLFGKNGTFFRTPESFESRNDVYHTRIFEHTFITCSKNNAEKIKAEFQLVPGIDRRVTPEQLMQMFPGAKSEETFPHYIYTGEKVDLPTLAEGYRLVNTSPQDHPLLKRFLEPCSEEDIDEAEIDLDDPDEVIELVYQKEKPIGYAGYRTWESGLGDMGILIYPEHRKKGLGRTAVAKVTEDCIRNGRLPLYRASCKNIGSNMIARSIGYELIWETAEITLPE